MSYKNASGFLSDEDWTIAQIVKAIRGSDHFAALSRKEQTSRMLSATGDVQLARDDNLGVKDTIAGDGGGTTGGNGTRR